VCSFDFGKVVVIAHSANEAIGSFQSMHPIFDLNIVEHYVVISW
jgi:hypothetical protein